MKGLAFFGVGCVAVCATIMLIAIWTNFSISEYAARAFWSALVLAIATVGVACVLGTAGQLPKDPPKS